MYYKRKSKTNWPVVITVSVVVFFLITISGILVAGFLKSRQNNNVEVEVGSNIKPNVELTLNTLEANQTEVLIQVKVSTTDEAGLEKIVIPGLDEIKMTTENQKEYTTTFKANKNGTYEIQAFGKNGVFNKEIIEISNIKLITSREPYIPTNFTQVEGTNVDTGLVIKDSVGNEYVWIPVPRGQLKRDRQETDGNYYEDEAKYPQFLNSVATYQGFYIARYEAGMAKLGDKDVVISKPNVTPINRISYNKASVLAQEAAEVYKYNNCHTLITSSSAWDTILDWVNNKTSGFSSSLDYGNYSGTLNKTGETAKDKVNNIFDLAGNVREWTTENYRLSDAERKNIQGMSDRVVDDYKVIRGGSTTYNSSPNRTSVGDKATVYENIGFRYVLYME